MSERETYTMEDRERWVAAYVVGGTFAKAAEITGHSFHAMRQYKVRHGAWWAEMEERIRREHEEEHRAKIREIIVAGLEQLEDRVKHGDHIMDKEGSLIRRPMIGRDLVIATGTMIDKLRISLGQPTSIQGKADATSDKLNALKQAAMNTAKAEAREAGKLVEMGAGASLAVASKTSEDEAQAA